MTVTATDPDGAASSADTTISLVDLNEAPVLPATIAFNVPQFPTIGDTIDTITATDEDRPADPLTYTLIDNASPAGSLKIDPSTGARKMERASPTSATAAVEPSSRTKLASGLSGAALVSL